MSSAFHTLGIAGRLRTLLMMALLALFVSGCATAPHLSGLHDAATQANQEGLALLEAGAFQAAQARFSDAVALLEEALATCEATGDCQPARLEVTRDNLALAYTNRAYTRMHLSDSDAQALADAERALELAPDLVQPHHYRAIIAIRSLDAQATWDEYLFLREHDPGFAAKLYQAYEEAFGPRTPTSGKIP